MLKGFRALVMWLMVLAIPIQGLAASAVLPCLPDQPAGVAATIAPAAAGHDHRVVSDGSAWPSIQHHPATGHAGHGTVECCSAACSLVAVVLPAAAARIQARSPAPPDPAATLYRGVVLDGLDRPPRPHLA